MSNEKKLLKSLVDQGLINDVQVKIITDYQNSVGGKLQDVVVKLGFVDRQQLTSFSGYESKGAVTLETVDLEVLETIPQKLLQGYTIVPVITDQGTVLACENELEPIIKEEICSLAERSFPVMRAPSGAVQQVLQQLFKSGPAPEAKPGKIPAVSIEDLCRILIDKGVITEQDLFSLSKG